MLLGTEPIFLKSVITIVLSSLSFRNRIKHQRSKHKWLETILNGFNYRMRTATNNSNARFNPECSVRQWCDHK